MIEHDDNHEHELGSIAEDSHGEQYRACDHCEFVCRLSIREELERELEERE